MAETDFESRMLDLGKDVVPLRDDKSMHWSDIAEKLQTGQGRVMQAYLIATVPKKEIVKGTDAERAKAVVQLRNKEKMSWGDIVARVRKPESWCRTQWSKSTGKDNRGDRIGKGGRYPGEASGNGAKKATKGTKAAKIAKTAKSKAAAKSSTKKTATKKAPAKKAPAKKAAKANTSGTAPAANSLADKTLGELKDRLNGKKITVEDLDEPLEVDTLSALDDGVLTLTTIQGDERKIGVASITGATK